MELLDIDLESLHESSPEELDGILDQAEQELSNLEQQHKTVLDMEQRGLTYGFCANDLEQLEEMFPDILPDHVYPQLLTSDRSSFNEEYALEGFSEVISKIVEFIAKYIHIIIPVLISLITAAISMFMKSSTPKPDGGGGFTVDSKSDLSELQTRIDAVNEELENLSNNDETESIAEDMRDFQNLPLNELSARIKVTDSKIGKLSAEGAKVKNDLATALHDIRTYSENTVVKLALTDPDTFNMETVSRMNLPMMYSIKQNIDVMEEVYSQISKITEMLVDCKTSKVKPNLTLKLGETIYDSIEVLRGRFFDTEGLNWANPYEVLKSSVSFEAFIEAMKKYNKGPEDIFWDKIADTHKSIDGSPKSKDLEFHYTDKEFWIFGELRHEGKETIRHEIEIGSTPTHLSEKFNLDEALQTRLVEKSLISSEAAKVMDATEANMVEYEKTLTKLNDYLSKEKANSKVLDNFTKIITHRHLAGRGSSGVRRSVLLYPPKASFIGINGKRTDITAGMQLSNIDTTTKVDGHDKPLITMGNHKVYGVSHGVSRIVFNGYLNIVREMLSSTRDLMRNAKRSFESYRQINLIYTAIRSYNANVIVNEERLNKLNKLRAEGVSMTKAREQLKSK